MATAFAARGPDQIAAGDIEAMKQHELSPEECALLLPDHYRIKPTARISRGTEPNSVRPVESRCTATGDTGSR
jgi:hypothetical protein